MIKKLQTLGAIARGACACRGCWAVTPANRDRAMQAPEPTPCLAQVFLESFLWLEDDEVAELIKAWEAT